MTVCGWRSKREDAEQLADAVYLVDTTCEATMVFDPEGRLVYSTGKPVPEDIDWVENGF
jgi:hypothetical protein